MDSSRSCAASIGLRSHSAESGGTEEVCGAYKVVGVPLLMSDKNGFTKRDVEGYHIFRLFRIKSDAAGIIALYGALDKSHIGMARNKARGRRKSQTDGNQNFALRKGRAGFQMILDIVITSIKVA